MPAAATASESPDSQVKPYCDGPDDPHHASDTMMLRFKSLLSCPARRRRGALHELELVNDSDFKSAGPRPARGQPESAMFTSAVKFPEGELLVLLRSMQSLP